MMTHCRQNGGSLGPYRESDTILNDRRIVPETRNSLETEAPGRDFRRISAMCLNGT